MASLLFRRSENCEDARALRGDVSGLQERALAERPGSISLEQRSFVDAERPCSLGNGMSWKTVSVRVLVDYTCASLVEALQHIGCAKTICKMA